MLWLAFLLKIDFSQIQYILTTISHPLPSYFSVQKIFPLSAKFSISHLLFIKQQPNRFYLTKGNGSGSQEEKAFLTGFSESGLILQAGELCDRSCTSGSATLPTFPGGWGETEFRGKNFFIEQNECAL